MLIKVTSLKTKIQSLSISFLNTSKLIVKHCATNVKEIKTPSNTFDSLCCALIIYILFMLTPQIIRLEVLIQFSLLNILVIFIQDADAGSNKNPKSLLKRMALILLKYTIVLLYLKMFTWALDSSWVRELTVKQGQFTRHIWEWMPLRLIELLIVCDLLSLYLKTQLSPVIIYLEELSYTFTVVFAYFDYVQMKLDMLVAHWFMAIPRWWFYCTWYSLVDYVNYKLATLRSYNATYTSDFYNEFYKQIQPLLPVNKPRLNLVNSLILESNQRKLLHVVPLNLNINRYSGLNTHFPSYKSSIILTLTVWQYWWWMSFIIVIVLFNRVVVKIFFQNTLKIEPKVHTSIKSNGRWGDLVASLFPVFWCSNILVNSNFILRVIENHSESGAYVLRIRGKQWYWVYKFSVNLKRDLNNISLIIGRGNKLNVTYGINNEYTNNFVKPSTRWTSKIKEYIYLNKKVAKQSISLVKVSTNLPTKLFPLGTMGPADIYNKITKWNVIHFTDRFVTQRPVKHDKYYLNTAKRQLMIHKTYKCHNNKLLVLKYQSNHGYRPYNRFFYSIQQQPKSAWKGLKTNNVIYFNSEKSFDLTNRQKTIIRKIKPLSVQDRKHALKKLRMLSTYNTLILPTNINITVITNSFDVVHSWFVPGLGLKFDCVPGRSTHYTLRVHKPGIYYGHCAEVCGRFHHHMPIKICALPLNQFMYYYNTYYKI